MKTERTMMESEIATKIKEIETLSGEVDELSKERSDLVVTLAAKDVELNMVRTGMERARLAHAHVTQSQNARHILIVLVFGGAVFRLCRLSLCVRSRMIRALRLPLQVKDSAASMAKSMEERAALAEELSGELATRYEMTADLKGKLAEVLARSTSQEVCFVAQ